MRKFPVALLAAALLIAGSVSGSGLASSRGSEAASRARSSSAGAAAVAALPVEEARGVVKQYCVVCHNDRAKTGGLTLASFDPGQAEAQAELAEKMIRKLRAGMMPPPGARRPPDPATLPSLATLLETRIDAAAAARLDPGWRPFQRLNRAEYARAIRELLDLPIDPAAFLPPDTVSHGFDNVADVQLFSTTLLEGYLRAAARISRLAVGDRSATPAESTYKVPRTASQMIHVEGTPYGTRGGIAVVHTFPADGEYLFKALLHGIPTGQLFGSPIAAITGQREQLEVSIDGERVALVEIDPRLSESSPTGLWVQTPPVHVTAGPHRVAAAFVQRFDGPVDDLLAPIEHTLADTQIGAGVGITTLPHLRDFTISGPHRVTGVSDTPSRRRIFTCRPTDPTEERPCARRIIGRLAAEAYRRPLGTDELESLMAFYETGRREEGNFEAGIRTALQAILASPHFVFRFERVPGPVKPGEPFRLTDLDLASRLAFFLWAAPPDAALVKLAAQGKLRQPGVLEAEVRRLLADPRAEALATRFAAQWLRLQDLDRIHPDALLYPQFDRTLAEAMRRETELFFEHLVREDRSVLEVLTADYTFVNERLARHYRIPNVAGDAFRRVRLPDEQRRGVLGHASILTLTSIADRTSPVLRGKWVMEVLLGTPPPPPPPNVPAFDETAGVKSGKRLTVRERLEEHRRNPACMSCHRVIDPIGLALEPFDVTGAWRFKDGDQPVDASGQLWDGTPLDGPASLRRALVKYSEAFLRTFTEHLLTYALGRRVDYRDMPLVRAIVREAAAQEYRWSAFVLGVVKSPAFQMSRAEAPATTEASASGARAALERRRR
jgi:cytochrome c5